MLYVLFLKFIEGMDCSLSKTYFRIPRSYKLYNLGFQKARVDNLNILVSSLTGKALKTDVLALYLCSS